jgi:hypothetical protein
LKHPEFIDWRVWEAAKVAKDAVPLFPVLGDQIEST